MTTTKEGDKEKIVSLEQPPEDLSVREVLEIHHEAIDKNCTLTEKLTKHVKSLQKNVDDMINLTRRIIKVMEDEKR